MTYIREWHPGETLARISYDEALTALDAGIAKAEELGIRIVLVIVDVAGEMVAVRRMDGCRPFNFDLAYALAYTCALVQLPGERLPGPEQKGWFHAARARRGGLIASARVCLCLKRGDLYTGAIGISGAAGDPEMEVLEAAVASVA